MPRLDAEGWNEVIRWKTKISAGQVDAAIKQYETRKNVPLICRYGALRASEVKKPGGVWAGFAEEQEEMQAVAMAVGSKEEGADSVAIGGTVELQGGS